MLCLMLLTLRHVYSGGAKPKILDKVLLTVLGSEQVQWMLATVIGLWKNDGRETELSTEISKF